MTQAVSILSLVVLFLGLAGCGQPQSEPPLPEGVIAPPVAAQKPFVLPDGRMDEYYWIRDDTRSNPEVLSLLAEENRYTAAVMAPTEGLQRMLFDEMSARLTAADVSVPVQRGTYRYHYEYREGGDYPVYLRAHHDRPDDFQTLLDTNILSKGHEYYRLGNWVVSADASLLAYAEDTVSRRLYTIRFIDLANGHTLPDELVNVAPSIAWANDGKSVFYVAKDLQTLLPDRVYRHRLGTPMADDVLVYQEQDPAFSLSLRKSKSDQYILISAVATDTTETWLVAADEPDAPPRVVLPRQQGHDYRLRHVANRFYILSNWQAPNYRLFSARDEDVDAREKWKEVAAHQADVQIEDVAVFASHLVLAERKNGLVQLVVRRRVPDGSLAPGKKITFPDPAYSVRLMGNTEASQSYVRYEYSSLVRPDSVFDYDFARGQSTLRKQATVAGGYDHSKYVSERRFFAARDGARVPVSLVYHRDHFKAGTSPGYLYAYGSYGYSTEALFDSKRLSLLDRGFVFAIIHVRGGQELGRHWYEDGRMLNKRNTFNDFVDGTRFLLEQGYVAHGKVFATGASAGGLLMGALVNEAPQLYLGVVAKVPFVDVVTTMMDDSIPLTAGEYLEWGNPAEPDQYRYMLSYSPYDQVRAQHYPNLLVTTGLHDSQVQYFEPVKWVSRLRRLKTDDNKLVIHIDLSTGHGGASGRYERHRLDSLEYAFILDLLKKHDH